VRPTVARLHAYDQAFATFFPRLARDGINPITNRNVTLTNFLADPTELRLLHMETGDPRGNPSFVMFANPNYFLDASSSNCPSTPRSPAACSCSTEC
jgi:hypothetical protein